VIIRYTVSLFLLEACALGVTYIMSPSLSDVNFDIFLYINLIVFSLLFLVTGLYFAGVFDEDKFDKIDPETSKRITRMVEQKLEEIQDEVINICNNKKKG